MAYELRVKDAAARLQLTEETVRDWLNTGKLKGIKLGKSWRIDPADIDRLLSEGSGRAPDPFKEAL
jgi:excisionase family DNA binding protein